MNEVEAVWQTILEAKLKDMKDRLVWLCVNCFNKLWTGRALGLTSHDPQVCCECNVVNICVLVSSIKLNINKAKGGKISIDK